MYPAIAVATTFLGEGLLDGNGESSNTPDVNLLSVHRERTTRLRPFRVLSTPDFTPPELEIIGHEAH